LWREVRRDLENNGLALDFAAWFLDDGTCAGTIDSVRRAVATIERLGPRYGIRLNPAKCEVIGNPEDTEAIAGVFVGVGRFVEWSRWQLLGTPCGDREYVADFLTTVVDNACRKTRLVAVLPDPHIAFALLRYCCGFGLAVYYMRASGPHDELFGRLDDATFEAFARITTAVDDSARAQVELPTRHGGFGLRPTAPHAGAAYIAAVMVATTYWPVLMTPGTPVDGDEVLLSALASPAISSSAKLAALATDYVRQGGRPGDHKQREFSHAIEDAAAERFVALLATDADRARVNSARAQHASSWLMPRPFEDDVDGWFRAPEFQALVRLRLGLPQHGADDGQPCQLCNGKSLADAAGRHSLTCLASGLRARVHNDVRDVVFRLAATALLQPRREAMCFPPSSLRADILLTRVPRRPIVVDVAVTHLDSSGSFAAAAAEPAGAATAYEATKRAKYGAHARDADVTLMPCVFDTHGACSATGLELLRFIAREWGRQFDLRPCRSVPLVMQRITTTLMRGIARLLLANGPAAGVSSTASFFSPGGGAPVALETAAA
jgi:hypothetical protein